MEKALSANRLVPVLRQQMIYDKVFLLGELRDTERLLHYNTSLIITDYLLVYKKKDVQHVLASLAMLIFSSNSDNIAKKNPTSLQHCKYRKYQEIK